MNRLELKEIVAKGHIFQALDLIHQTTRSNGNERLYNNTIQLKSRYQDLQRKIHSGIISDEDSSIQMSKITVAILALIDELYDGSATPSPPHKPDNPSNNPPIFLTGTGDGKVTTGTGDGGSKLHSSISWIIGLVLLVGMVLLLVFVPCPTAAQFFAFRLALALAAGGLATLLPGMFGLDMKNGIKAAGALGIMVLVYLVNPGTLAGGGKCDEGPFNFTVRLVKKQNLPNYPPLKGGSLKVWVVDRYEKPELNSDYVAEVKGVPSIQDGNMVDAYLEDATYWKLAMDSVRLSKLSQMLNVVPDGSLDTLSGKTMVDGDPLPGASIEVEGGLNATSDAAGRFAIPIPLPKQKDMLLVSAYKLGFGKLEERHNPASGDKVFSFAKPKKAATSKKK